MARCNQMSGNIIYPDEHLIVQQLELSRSRDPAFTVEQVRAGQLLSLKQLCSIVLATAVKPERLITLPAELREVIAIYRYVLQTRQAYDQLQGRAGYCEQRLAIHSAIANGAQRNTHDPLPETNLLIVTENGMRWAIPPELSVFWDLRVFAIRPEPTHIVPLLSRMTYPCTWCKRPYMVARGHATMAVPDVQVREGGELHYQDISYWCCYNGIRIHHPERIWGTSLNYWSDGSIRPPKCIYLCRSCQNKLEDDGVISIYGW